jgi:hypothetical protein
MTAMPYRDGTWSMFRMKTSHTHTHTHTHTQTHTHTGHRHTLEVEGGPRPETDSGTGPLVGPWPSARTRHTRKDTHTRLEVQLARADSSGLASSTVALNSVLGEKEMRNIRTSDISTNIYIYIYIPMYTYIYISIYLYMYVYSDHFSTYN